ncbi:MAG TPA: peptide-methionine (S)-S-oxide reductase MsrA [Rhizomicrobium sp.]|jgi:peptide-methionine (S)-S-oxide reductase
MQNRYTLATVMAGLLLCTACALADETAPNLPMPKQDEAKVAPGGTETAVLSGGCFWGMQGVFEHVKGVRQVVAGYAGGQGSTAQYEEVSTGTTGHAESVRVTFDPGVVSYGQILRVYFSAAHNPTELNRQGPDDGTQYRSDIFATNAEQVKVARAYIAQLSGAHIFQAPIVTRVDNYTGFYPAEAYHQDYLIRNPSSLYIMVNDLPKIDALKRLYPQLYRDAPVRVSEKL